MSRIIGDALVAGGSLSPQAEATRLAVDALLRGLYLYGWPLGRGHGGMVRDALKALCPEALECIVEHGEHEAWKRYGIPTDDWFCCFGRGELRGRC